MKRRLLIFLSLCAATELFGQDVGSVAGVLASQGFAGAPLKRRFGNHLFVPVSINNHRAALMIDTGAPITIIDRSSVGTFGLKVQTTRVGVGRVFGPSGERFGLSEISTLAMGNCVLTNVPVAVADEADMNEYTRLAHLDGLFGAHEMRRFGAVIDCARQMLYISPHGPNGAASAKLAGFLAARGFTRVPLHENSNGHFEVDGAINGRSTRFIVDTGASTTLLSKQLGVAAGVAPAPTHIGVEKGAGQFEHISSGVVKDFSVGSFALNNAEVALGNVSNEMLRGDVQGESNAGLLGIEHMSLNFAVIDLGSMSLYLRHPDKR